MITKELQSMRPLRGDERLERDSEYLGADDIYPNTEPVLTIKNLYRGKVTLSRGKEVKNVLTFAEETVPGITEVRPLIVNSTNRQTLKKLYKGVTANALEGKKIQLYIEHGVRNPSNGELTDGIRIRDFIPKEGKAYKAPKCAICGADITGINNFTAEQIAANTKKAYGKQMCVACGQKEKAAREAPGAVEDNKVSAAEVTAAVNEPNDLAAQLMAAAGE